MKRQYDIQFKIDAAKLVDEQGYTVPETRGTFGCTNSEYYPVGEAVSPRQTGARS